MDLIYNSNMFRDVEINLSKALPCFRFGIHEHEIKYRRTKQEKKDRSNKNKKEFIHYIQPLYIQTPPCKIFQRNCLSNSHCILFSWLNFGMKNFLILE